MKRSLLALATVATLATAAVAATDGPEATAPADAEPAFCELDEVISPEVDAALICTDDWCQDRCESKGCQFGVCIPQGACRCYVC
ncbi:MAG: hypothetical protein KTR31_21885 [Myxococcales bacterium]|nr:hypothetical protein [Myxococcales bacterium]